MKRRYYGVTTGLLVAIGCSGGGRGDGDAGADGGSGTGIATAFPGPGSDGTGGTGDSQGEGGTTAGSVSAGLDTGEPVCGEVNVALEAVPPNVVLVLDKSGSMVLNSWDSDLDPETPDETRWQSLFDVVELVGTQFDTAINLGAVLFPIIDASIEDQSSFCAVASEPDIPVMPSNTENILATIPPRNSTDIAGATPASAGIQTALDHLKSLDPAIPRFMILVTDGAANCSATATDDQCGSAYPNCSRLEIYDENLPIVVGQALTEDDIPTFVVGIDIDPLAGVENTANDDGAPAADTYQELNTVAEAGGRARSGEEKFFNATNEIALEAALQEIAGQVVSCVIPLDPQPLHPDFVTITVGDQTVPQVEDCSSEDGWVYTNPDGPYEAVELCGTACDALAETGTLDAVYGCPPAG